MGARHSLRILFIRGVEVRSYFVKGERRGKVRETAVNQCDIEAHLHVLLECNFHQLDGLSELLWGEMRRVRIEEFKTSRIVDCVPCRKILLSQHLQVLVKRLVR